MAQTIQIKRGSGSSVPSSLAEAELAINLDSGKLYYGSGSSVSSDFTFDSIIAETYVISSSVTHMTTSFSSGSTAFGDSSADQHTFTGNITASGNISSSNNFYSKRAYLYDNESSYLASGTNPILHLKNTNAGTNADTYIKFESTDNGSHYSLGIDTSRNTFVIGSGSYLTQDSSPPFSLKDDKIAINKVGGLPSYTLDVTGDIRCTDDLFVNDDATITGDLDVDGTTNLDAVDIDGNVQLDGTFTVATNDNGVGYDVKLYGATANKFALWDASQDHLKLPDNTKLVLGTSVAAAAFNASLYHDGTDLNLTNTVGEFKISTDTVRITAGTAGDANLILQSDTDDSEEADNPFMLFEQDGGAISSIIGHAGANDEYPNANTFTGGLSNHLIIAQSGSGTSKGIQFGTGNNARVTIDTDGKVGIGNNNPSYTLDITGDFSATGNIRANGNIIGDGATIITGIDKLAGTTDDILEITSDSDIVYKTDDDGDEVGQHIFKERTTTLLTLDETQATFTVPIASSGTIQAGWHGSTTRIKILVSDFIPDDVGRPAMIDDSSSDRWLESHGSAKLFASLPIPTGFKATHVHIYGSGTSALEVSEMNINSKTVTSKGTGNIGTELDITDVTSSTTNYLLLELVQASGEEVYGGYVTIAAV